MKSWKHILIAALGTLALSLGACGSDDDDNGGGGGGDGTSGGGTSGDGSSGGGGHNIMDACLNESDGMIIQSTDVTGQATNCGLGCVGQDESCAKTCVVNETGLTDDCAQCYADIINCTIEHCLSDCVSDPESEACVMCREENCNPAFYVCSGLDDGSGD